MELEEAKERLLELSRISEEGARLHPEDSEMFLTDKEALETAIAELHAMQNLLDEKNEEIDRLHKENDLARKALIANSYEADERNNLLVKIQELQKENEKLKEIDLTTVHIKGVCDEKERWRNKIREKIDNRISIVEKMLDEMIDKSIGCINVSLLNKKEKEEVINKRNCLTVQKATLEDIKKDLLKEE